MFKYLKWMLVFYAGLYLWNQLGPDRRTPAEVKIVEKKKELFGACFSDFKENLSLETLQENEDCQEYAHCFIDSFVRKVDSPENREKINELTRKLANTSAVKSADLDDCFYGRALFDQLKNKKLVDLMEEIR